MYVVIAGCGNLGRRMAEDLSSRGNEVVVMDTRLEALEALSPEFGGFRVEGDAADALALQRVKLDRADLAIAATDDDNANLFFSQAARFLYSVPRALARVHDPAREAVFRRLGVETVCPTAAAADLMLALLFAASGGGAGA
jgi:trk system potassium uptake protein TrkA